MKKLMIPAALVLLGTGAAFATKAANSTKSAVIPTYRMDPESGLCVQVGQECSTIQNVVCRWTADGVTPLHSAPISPTECGSVLFKP
ncbi:DUF6520 family protein [Chryseobacterium sp. SIMBA_029]|uniref:DUF6520 family protein n=1 Tax=Chryseobacterium sp. SIMBA_029 TaxID=3085772 RepID=UPI00397B4B3B